MTTWNATLDVARADVGTVRVMAFGHVEGTCDDSTLPDRIPATLGPLLASSDWNPDWLLGKLAARLTVDLSVDKTRAGEPWSIVIDGLQLPGHPPMSWSKLEARARNTELAMARMNAEADAAASTSGPAPEITPAEQAEIERKRQAVMALAMEDIAREDAMREAATIVLSVEQYASLCAERALSPSAVLAVAQRYGLRSEAVLKAEDDEWRQRFQADPAEYSRFQQVYQQWIAWLQRPR